MTDVIAPTSSSRVHEFMGSMPAAYATAFTRREAEVHAEVVARRGSELSHVEVVEGRTAGSSRVCLVAGDRPGLLSIVADALLAHGLSVKSAHIYCRKRPDQELEAVDFFELAPRSRDEEHEELDPADVASFAVTLRQMLAEQLPNWGDEVPTLPPAAAERTRVYFDLEALRREKYVLVVQTPDFAGLLFAVTNALHAQQARVVSAEIRTLDDVADDRFELAASEPFTPARLCDLQLAVYVALVAAGARG